MINFIIELSILQFDCDIVFVGQTIYSYFLFNPKIGEVIFLKDEEEYKALIYDSFFDGDTWKASYIYLPEKKCQIL